VVTFIRAFDNPGDEIRAGRTEVTTESNTNY
jgi:hypothetical protein